MFRVAAVGLVAMTLVGYVTNNVASTASPNVLQGVQTQQATAASQGNRAAPADAGPAMTPAARIASAKLVVVNKVALNGEQLNLSSYQSLAPDCTPLGHVATRITTQPAHGNLQIVDGSAFPNYSPGDPPYRCDGTKSPATLLSYRSVPGYVGLDTTVVEVFFPNGNAPTIRYNIMVK